MTCGIRAPASGRQRYCSVCTELEAIPQDEYDDDDEYAAAVNQIYDRLDRISHAHALYRRRHRRW